jgi:hypothetical protein
MVQHSDDETLALIALGESADPMDMTHVQQCPRCQSRLDQLTAVVAATSAVTPDDYPVSPPEKVWTSIQAELGIGGVDVGVTDIANARSRRGSRIWLAAMAAAFVGVAVGAVVTTGLQQSKTNDVVIASAALDPIADSGFWGSASVEQVDGQSVLVVAVPDLPAMPDGYYEVWMATSDTSTMVAMGTLNAGHVGRFTVPDGMDPSAFPVVDVSVEHFDGDNGHSATSVVRGQFSA